MSGVATSKMICRRQAQIEEKLFRLKAPRRSRRIEVLSEEDVAAVISRHVAKAHKYIKEGNVELAGWYAKQAVNYRRTARALEICRDYNRAYWKACHVARHELYNCVV